jgi:energy-coupling factor transporter transmembrane protein EcfT
MDTLLGVLFIVLLFCGSFPYWVFGIAALIYFRIHKHELAIKGEDHLASTAVLVGAASAVTSLSYGIHVPASQTSCIICATPGGIYRGWPLGWFGLGGGDLIAAPFFLGLDILVWASIALLFLSIANRINHRFQWLSHKTAVYLISIMVLLIPFTFSTPPVMQATNWVNQQIEASNKQQELRRQQEFDKRVRLGVDTFNSAIRFETCRDYLVPSAKIPGAYDLLVEVEVNVNLGNAYIFDAGTDDTGYHIGNAIHQNFSTGKHKLSFHFDMVHWAHGPSSVDGHTYVKGWESKVTKQGPYTISIHLIQIGNVNGQPFGYYEIERAKQLGLIDETKIQMACITEPYKIEEFRIPKGVIPEP